MGQRSKAENPEGIPRQPRRVLSRDEIRTRLASVRERLEAAEKGEATDDETEEMLRDLVSLTEEVARASGGGRMPGELITIPWSSPVDYSRYGVRPYRNVEGLKGIPFTPQGEEGNVSGHPDHPRTDAI